MQIGIVGAGKIGGSLAALLARYGHHVYLVNSRGPESLTEQVGGLGAVVTPATIADAVARSDVVVVAIPFGRYRELPADAFDGKIVIDTTNYYPQRDGHLSQLDAGTTTSSELLATHLAGARLVKAFNTIYFERLRSEGRPGAPEDLRLAIPVAGDDPSATRAVAGLIDQIGFAPVEHGALAAGRHQQPGTPVYNVPVGVEKARALLAQPWPLHRLAELHSIGCTRSVREHRLVVRGGCEDRDVTAALGDPTQTARLPRNVRGAALPRSAAAAGGDPAS